ncbi:hypothetical protein N7468_002155 [Penicillium chermesinum]|uniref:DNA mismatch repair protein MSH5 n=1 Tax=Penicillium chermesinum TaxID=63820 RepID=A0A9W9PJC6_9EURO|nr:uncharacterized protein N7468_002155 [Penicillium chermesinum]KAJ5247172.1 hypothetical protein N7468_002155 [Penicillium chermesinum]
MHSILKRKRSSATEPSRNTPHSEVSRSDSAASGPSSLRATQHQTSSFAKPQLRTQFQTGNHWETANSDTFSDHDLGHVIAAVDMKDNGTVGCAYYSDEEETLYLLSDGRSGGMEVIDTCEISNMLHHSTGNSAHPLTVILQIKPTVVVAPSRVDLDQKQNLAQDNCSSSYLPYRIDIRPNQEFSPSDAETRLTALEISSAHEQRMRFFVPHSGIAGPDEGGIENIGFTLNEGRLLHISSAINTENPVTLGCVGAILNYLQKRRATNFNAESSEACSPRIHFLKMFNLKDTMWMSRNALLSLQIVQSESHPNMFNQGPGKKSSSGKEGLSVFGLFRRFAYTPQGRARLKQIIFCPSLDHCAIRERHHFIGVFSRPDNMAVVEKMTKALKHIKNLRPAMINLHKGISTGSGKTTGFKSTVWESLLAFAFYAIDIHVSMQEVSGADALKIRVKALRTFEASQLHRVGRMIQEIVDIDNSDEQGRTVVKQGVDRELDRIKDQYDGLSSLLKHVAIDIARTIPETFDIDVNVIYFPQLGFNIAVPLNARGQAAYSGTDGDWELVFITENRAYFKDFRMRELDQKLGDIYGLICEKEIEIVYDLAQRMLQYENVLVDASDICGEIDSLLALTQAAGSYKLTRPQMVSENVIKIKGGRHILQELAVPSYVPNDTELVGGQEANKNEVGEVNISTPSMLLLTGPNFSGKSVYMKQLWLKELANEWNHSFVPAESAELGITDKILTKIHTQESVSKIQSTFMTDLQQVSLCLKQVTGRSLVLIDEFGKGTNEGDGIGLACGILEYLLSLEDAPKVLAATHFHEIFENDFLPLRPRLQLAHMEVKVCEEDSREAGEQVTYLYNLWKGRSTKSFGTICAATNGIDAAIVARANEIALLVARGENPIAACATLTAEETRILQQADALARNFLKMTIPTPEEADHHMKATLEELIAASDYRGTESA